MNINEKNKRVRFVRALEKIAKRAAASLKKPEFDKELFKAQLSKAALSLSKLEPVHLDSAYTKELLSFVNECIKDDFTKDELLKKANKLHQLKNNKSYKKDKHKKNLS